MSYNLDQISEGLTEAVSDAFENLFFADIEKCVDLEELSMDEEALLISVDTVTPFKSVVGLLVEKDFSEEIVMEMTGGDFEEITEEMVDDALAEIGNTIVGRFLSKVVPEDEEFSLGFPVCKQWDNENDKYTKNENCRIFALEMEETKVYCIINLN